MLVLRTTLGTFYLEFLMNTLKPPLTYSEQIDRLINIHNLKIDDRDHAEDILKKTNYYRLSAYGIGLKQKDDIEKYLDGVSIEQLYRLYLFDSKLKNALIHTVELIEIQLRSQLAYHLSMKYGADGYMDPLNFMNIADSSGVPYHTAIIDKFNAERTRQRAVPFVKHHETKYNGKYPMWVAIELFTFGNVASLFSIMRDDDRLAIAKLYNTSPNYLKSWILSLVEVRNICAHYGRLYNMPLKQSPRLYKEFKQHQNNKPNKLFPVIITIQRILCSNTDWDNFAIRLESIMDEYFDVVKLSFIGFPQNWKAILKLTTESRGNIDANDKLYPKSDKD